MVERYPEEEPQRSDRAVEGRRWNTRCTLMHLILAQVLPRGGGRRAAEERKS
jgi:hypothetical protein